MVDNFVGFAPWGDACDEVLIGLGFSFLDFGFILFLVLSFLS